jgi:hypothetical protein
MTIYCENADSVLVDIVQDSSQFTIKFEYPPLSITEDLLEDTDSELVKWIIRRKLDDAIVYERIGQVDDSFGDSKEDYICDEEICKYTTYDIYVNGTKVANLPVINYFFTDRDGDYSCNYTVDYYDPEQISIAISAITFSDNENSYTYPLDEITTYKVRCDGCEPGDCKATKERYPGYVCMDCKDLESRLKKIGSKLNEQIRR